MCLSTSVILPLYSVQVKANPNGKAVSKTSMWTIQGSNLRPSHYECAALTDWAKGPWHAWRDSNPHQRFWRPVCYHCTTNVNKKENRRWFSGHLFLRLALLRWIPANSGYISQHSLSNYGYNHSLINFLGGPGRTRTYMLVRGRIYSPLSQPIAQPIQIAGYLGFEPRTARLTVESSTAELIPNLWRAEIRTLCVGFLL